MLRNKLHAMAKLPSKGMKRNRKKSEMLKMKSGFIYFFGGWMLLTTFSHLYSNIFKRCMY